MQTKKGSDRSKEPQETAVMDEDSLKTGEENGEKETFDEVSEGINEESYEENKYADNARSDEDEQEIPPAGTGETIVLESDDPNVIRAEKNPDWKPIGTSQTGEHITQYKKGTVDWQEMERAISYATGIPVDNMIVWRIERGEVPNKNVVGTITIKEQTEIYRVYLEWVDGKGWMPTLLEHLRENDKKQ